jgi:ferric-dicitrate binding protein FerR (iron transport regulator)
MDRIKKIILVCGCLISLALWGKASLETAGIITQIQGQPTFFPYLIPGQNARPIKTAAPLLLNGSYLTDKDSHFTAKILEHHWLRLSPNSKCSIELDPEQKLIIINLYFGSVKVLFAGRPGDNHWQRLQIKSGDAIFESGEGKFSVVKNALFNENSVYVEKGQVSLSSQRPGNEQRVKVGPYQSAYLKDREINITPVRSISEKELNFIKDAKYLHIK